MNRGDINALHAAGGFPSVTITAPLRPQIAQGVESISGVVCLEGQVAYAKTRLEAELSKQDARMIADKLDRLLAELDLSGPLEGAYLAVNAQLAQGFLLPVPLEPRTVIAEAFATQQVRYALNRTPRYWLLVLGEAPTRLFEGGRESLIEVCGHGFPLVQESAPEKDKKDKEGAATRDEQQRAFFRQVDEQLAPLLQDDPVPLVLAGTERQLAQFEKGCDHKRLIMTTLEGRHETKSTHTLGALVWPAVEAAFAERRKAVLSALEVAVSARRYVSDLSEAWRMAHAGRGDTLVVEEDFHYPARVVEDGLTLEPSRDLNVPGFMPDAVDELIETVIARRGQVVFVPPGTLNAQQLVLTLRY